MSAMGGGLAQQRARLWFAPRRFIAAEDGRVEEVLAEDESRGAIPRLEIEELYRQDFELGQ
jgi:hypothetical protein